MIKKRLLYLSILLLLFGCNRGDELQPVLELPTITTINATNVSGTAAHTSPMLDVVRQLESNSI